MEQGWRRAVDRAGVRREPMGYHSPNASSNPSASSPDAVIRPARIKACARSMFRLDCVPTALRGVKR